ncbi:MAG TPA: hypothetical protein VE444_08330 [Gaiellaceae bacterium]|nr:hypothetical protein [Gaiellaceae bacterium]
MVALAVALLLALPQEGVLVPGRSLAGVELGATERQARRTLGPFVGVCRGCDRRTLYFTRGEFEETGVGAEFVRGRAVALYTLGMPRGWRTRSGLRLGAAELEFADANRGALRTECGHYSALSVRRGRAVTVFWVRAGTLWAFGIQRPSVPLCR